MHKAKIRRMAEAVVNLDPNKAELTCLTIMLEATLRVVKQEHSKKLGDIMREVAKEVNLGGAKPHDKPSYEEHEDVQADTRLAMDEEDVGDAEKQPAEAAGAAGGT